MWFDGLVSLFNGISTISLKKNSSGTILNHRWRDEGVHTFPKGISLKIKAIAQLEFKFTNYNMEVQQVSERGLPHAQCDLKLNM